MILGVGSTPFLRSLCLIFSVRGSILGGGSDGDPAAASISSDDVVVVEQKGV